MFVFGGVQLTHRACNQVIGHCYVTAIGIGVARIFATGGVH